MKLLPFDTAAPNSGTQFSRHLRLRASCPINSLSRERTRVHSPHHIAKTIPNLSCGNFPDPKNRKDGALVCARRLPGTVPLFGAWIYDAEPFQAECHDRQCERQSSCHVFSAFLRLWVTGPRAMRRNLCLCTCLHLRVCMCTEYMWNHQIYPTMCAPWICRKKCSLAHDCDNIITNGARLCRLFEHK